MIRIRHADGEAEISGTVPALRAIAEQLKAITDGEVKSFTADTTGSPAPYDRYLSALEVRAGDGTVRVNHEGDALVVTGSPDRLDALASWFWFSEHARRGHHSHYEHSTNPDVAEDALPLVIAVE